LLWFICDSMIKLKMPNIFSRLSGAKAFLLCQAGEGRLKVAKCGLGAKGLREFTVVQSEPLAAPAGEKEAADKLRQLCKGLGVKKERIIFIMPRNQVTCRYLKVPARSPEEIEKIASLQASRYLPYQAEELVTAHQLIGADKDGFSRINLVIAHKSAVERYLQIMRSLETKHAPILLSSYGLCILHKYCYPGYAKPDMLVDIDSAQAELVVSSGGKMIFSRYFGINTDNPKWKGLLAEEISKTLDAYGKEVGGQEIARVVILDKNGQLGSLPEELRPGLKQEIAILPYLDKITISAACRQAAAASRDSFAGLFGIGTERFIPPEMNLLPASLKTEINRYAKAVSYLRPAIAGAAAAVMLLAAAMKSLDNKTLYLSQLKKELASCSKEAAPLEEIERRLDMLRERASRKQAFIDIFYELIESLPREVSLVNVSYEEGADLSLRGQCADLNPVLGMVAEIEKKPLFKGYSVKVRYATKKKTRGGELLDFEVNCAKK